MRTPKRIFLILATLVLLAGCGCGRKEPVNVIWITLDALRADHLGCYGYPLPTSPAIDGLAEAGVLFEEAFSQAPSTKASVASMFTSLHPSIHQAVSHGKAGREGDVLSGKATTIAERLSDAGMLSAGFVANPHLQKTFGFHQGFEVYRYLSIGPVAKADKVLGEAAGWLAGEADISARPFFVYIHLMDTHFPYEPPPPHRRQFVDPSLEGCRAIYTNGRPDTPPSPRELEYLRGIYDGALHFADHQIHKFIQELDRLGLRENSLLVITADHGDEFLDHGGLGHGSSLYNELIRVPLIMILPGRLPAGQVIRTPVAMVDLGPTILSLCGLSWDTELVTGVDRSSLLMRGDPKYASRNTPPLFSERARFQIAMISGNYKYIFRRKSGKSEKLFDLVGDRGETKNLIWSEQALHDRMAEEATVRLDRIRELGEQLGLDQSTAPMTDGTRRQLRQLGYIE
jgi:arylsulfatase A-like enzyme